MTNPTQEERDLIRKVLAETRHNVRCRHHDNAWAPCNCDRDERAMLTYGRLTREAGLSAAITVIQGEADRYGGLTEYDAPALWAIEQARAKLYSLRTPEEGKHLSSQNEGRG